MIGAALLLALALQVPQDDPWKDGPRLPRPVSNNAVAAMETRDGPAVFSFLGMDETRLWDGVVQHAYRWTLSDRTWEELPPVPGPGRLAATAQAVGGKIYVFGGYTVAESGAERSLPSVDVFDPETATWSRGADMPVAVDDAISGVWRDSLIYLVSGWHDRDNVSNVQIYDPAGDRWQQATPIPGRPVFGHAGGLAGNTIVYVDGAATHDDEPRFRLEAASWRGDIDPRHPRLIRWTRIRDHPGPALYRSAGGAVGPWVLLGGGSDNPYNYTGVGYDRLPSEPRKLLLGFHVGRGTWGSFDAPPPSMDHRNVAVVDGRLIVVGGMARRQEVTDRVVWAPLDAALGRAPATVTR